MTPRERFSAALLRKPLTGRVPHFELVFYLTMEAMGKVHPAHRDYRQWDQMTANERQAQRRDVAQLLVDIARRFEHGAINIRHRIPGGVDETLRIVELIREISDDEFFVMLGGDTTYGIPPGKMITKWCAWLHENLPAAKREAAAKVDKSLAMADKVRRHGGVDGFTLCCDYCFSTGPFLSPSMFSEVVTPYLARLISGYRELGFLTIKHTEGNILPILDQLLQANPHALHSLDPKGGIDIAHVKRIIGHKICLIGNVDCGMLAGGTDQQLVESASYALQHGMPGGGYIFSTSDCIYTGAELARYEMMLEVWRRQGNYAVPAAGYSPAQQNAR